MDTPDPIAGKTRTPGRVPERFRYAVAVDVHYPPEGGARAALVCCADARFERIVAEHVVEVTEVAPYRPGSFFTRELPPLRAVLALVTEVDLIVVDGYVDLDPQGRPGLGAHVYHEYGVPVIGVAKTAFATATHAVPVRRGRDAVRPLHVTAAGVDLSLAAHLVTRMAGPYRLPTALRRVDRLARGRVDRPG